MDNFTYSKFIYPSANKKFIETNWKINLTFFKFSIQIFMKNLQINKTNINKLLIIKIVLVFYLDLSNTILIYKKFHVIFFIEYTYEKKCVRLFLHIMKYRRKFRKYLKIFKNIRKYFIKSKRI